MLDSLGGSTQCRILPHRSDRMPALSKASLCGELAGTVRFEGPYGAPRGESCRLDNGRKRSLEMLSGAVQGTMLLRNI